MNHHAIKSLTLLVLVFILTIWGNASDPNSSIPPEDMQAKIDLYQKMNSLPIELTPEEMTRLDEIGIGFEKTAPPLGQIGRAFV